MLKTFFIKEFWWEKNSNYINWLSTLKNTHNLKVVKFENLKNKKFIEFLKNNSRVFYHM